MSASPWQAEWRNPRRGTANPERVRSPHWSWLITSETTAWAANQAAGGPSSIDAGPAWSFERFGMATVPLGDGRSLHIAGEHEDHYDADFFIYNDVIVEHPDGSFEFWLYPESVFPPTDFHSATRLGDEVVLIGSLGYPRSRRPGHTPILMLDVHTGRIRSVQGRGDAPGWIHGHAGQLDDDGIIVVSGGTVWTRDKELVENIDDWALDPRTWTWERRTDRRWPSFSVARDDGERHKLWDMRQWLWSARNPNFASEVDFPAPRDADLLERLYPDAVQDPESFSTYRAVVDGVVVRYEERMQVVELTVEGHLPPAQVDALVDRLVRDMSTVLGSPCSARKLRG